MEFTRDQNTYAAIVQTERGLFTLQALYYDRLYENIKNVLFPYFLLSVPRIKTI